MRKPGRLIQRGLWLATLAACASARPVFEMRPIQGTTFNAQWPEVLRTRYQCGDDVVGPALAAVRSGFLLESRLPTAGDRGRYVCDLVGLLWPVRVRAFETDSGIAEQWEFRIAQHPETEATASGPWMLLEGPSPHLLRLVRYEGP